MAVMDINYLSYYLKRYVNLKVILPIENTESVDPDFKSKPEKFKTLYLLHGFSGCCGDWLYGSHIFKIARDHNLAVVMPSGENSFYIDQEEKGLMYGSFIAEELVKATRRMFPLSDRREDTFIGGLSMGGFGSLLLGSRFHDKFGAIIALSGAYDVTDSTFKQVLLSPSGFPKAYYDDIFGNIDEPVADHKNPITMALDMHKKGVLPPVYMACGTEDFLFDINVRTKNLLMEAGVNVTWEQGSGAHDWYFWDAFIEKAVSWCFNL